MVTVRDAKPEDITRLTEIYNWAVENTTATFDLVKQTEEKRMEWFNHYGGVHPLLAAELEGRVVGYSSLSKFREKEAYARSVEVSVYVDPDYHGKGIGTILLKEIVGRAVALGHHVIIAGITAGNEVSIRMHEKLGFELCGIMKEVGRKFDRWQDVCFYQRII